METILQTKTEEVLNHHVAAFIEADIDEIMRDYTESSELLTPDGALKGLDSIRFFFEEIFKIIPKGSVLELKQQFIREDMAYIVWSGESSFVSVPVGSDTFIMKNDKILFQNLAAHVIPKQ